MIKFEILNPKHETNVRLREFCFAKANFQISNDQNILNFGNFDFDIVSDFDIRISDF